MIHVKSTLSQTFKLSIGAVFFLTPLAVQSRPTAGQEISHIIKPKVYPAKQFFKISTQQSVITGKVTDSEGNPVGQVKVTQIGTKNVAITQADGSFSIKVSGDNPVLQFSSSRFETQAVTLEAGQNDIKVILKENSRQLDEVVLIGYQKVNRNEVGGAVSTVNVPQMEEKSVGVVGIDRSLVGLLKGVRITQNTGTPGSPVLINVRGITSPLTSNQNQPLYVIDGVPFNVDATFDTSASIGNPLLNLDPSSIERIDVLKDAAATSIYGSRGANGVILIETKRGRLDQPPQLRFSYNHSFGQPIKFLKVLNRDQFIDYNKLIVGNTVDAINAGEVNKSFVSQLQNIANVTLDPNTGQYVFGGLKDNAFGTANTNWNRAIYRNVANTDQVRMGISGGGKFTDYDLSAFVTNQQGVRIDSKLQTYNIHTNINSQVRKYLRIGGTLDLNYNKDNSGTDTFDSDPAVASTRPDVPVRNPDGSFADVPSYAFGFLTMNPNPVAALQRSILNNSYSVTGNTYVEILPIDRLSIKAQTSGAWFMTDGSRFTPKAAQPDYGVPKVSNLVDSDYFDSNLTLNLTTTYSFKIAKQHSFNLLAGYSRDRTNTKGKNYNLYYFPDDNVLNDINSAGQVLAKSSQELQTGMDSFFGRVMYGYRGIYNLTLNFRSDKSSKFGPHNKRGYFPSAALSVNLTHMDFLKGNKNINNLNFRISHGKTGSSNIPNFVYLQFFQSSSFYNYGGQQSLVPNFTLANPSIKWETTKGTNIGVDYAFFGSRLRGSIDVYYRKTNDALAPAPIPLELGATDYTSNLMDISNKGIEIEIGGDIIKTERLRWQANLNWAINRNRLLNLHGANLNPNFVDNYVIGKPVGAIKGYIVDEIIQSQQELDGLNNGSPTGLYSSSSLGVGDFKFKDVNGDGRITTDDRVLLGTPEPKFFGGFNTSVSYKHFNLGLFFDYSVGGKAVWSNLQGTVRSSLLQNQLSTYALNTWTPDDPNAKYARAILNDPSNNRRLSNKYVFNKSYLRLNTLQLSYNFASSLLKNWPISEASIFFNASNLFTITNWPGTDPGATSANPNLAFQGSNTDPYPLARTYSIGVAIKL